MHSSWLLQFPQHFPLLDVKRATTKKRNNFVRPVSKNLAWIFRVSFQRFEMEENFDGPSFEKVDFVNVDLGDLVDLGVKVKVEKCDEDCGLQSCGSELVFVDVKAEKGEASDDGKDEDPLEQPYTCDEPGCLKTFSDRFKLEKHQRSHNICRIAGCSETFANRKKLLLHKRWHLKQRSHPCPVYKCGKAFRGKADLNRHMKVLHKEKMDSGELFQPQTQPRFSPLPPLNLPAEDDKPMEVSVPPSNKKVKESDDDTHCQDKVLHLKENKLSWPGPDCDRKPPIFGTNQMAGVKMSAAYSLLAEEKALQSDASHLKEDEPIVKEEGRGH